MFLPGTSLIPAHTSTLLILVAMVTLVVATSPTSETCFSRQHQNALVNVPEALNRSTTIMDSRVVQSERECVLACCSEDIRPGVKCTLAVFNPLKSPVPPSKLNCHLFHCQSEQDCPLQQAELGINTYDIYKGLIHPTIRPSSPSTVQPTTTTSTATTTAQTTLSTLPTTTTTTTTPALHLPAPPRSDPEPRRTIDQPQQAPTTSAPATSRLAVSSTIATLKSWTTPASLLLPSGVQTAPASPGTEGHGGRKEATGRGALKSSLVVVAVLGLAILTLALAVMGRKAMESFDRRHYTRLELNDLHYEV
ncbi:hypothetical protein DPEC_G00318340 [Dallia pectoralis]|uniref:Uncharacterized protein n=1 Tax=Dallia pectoralis TaxID=75939 RepID=A0ACC2F9A3_DALPE|nr:hypothetical protein DPEC_G00318340 [Dallia pectoralis]